VRIRTACCGFVAVIGLTIAMAVSTGSQQAKTNAAAQNQHNHRTNSEAA
jgi:hypothetical protein